MHSGRGGPAGPPMSIKRTKSPRTKLIEVGFLQKEPAIRSAATDLLRGPTSGTVSQIFRCAPDDPFICFSGMAATGIVYLNWFKLDADGAEPRVRAGPGECISRGRRPTVDLLLI